MNIPWWIFALATFAIVWVFTHFGIKLSLRTTAIFGALEILIMLALAITFLVHPGHGSSYTAPLNPANAPNHWRRHPGRDGLLGTRAQRLRGARAAGPGDQASRASSSAAR